MSLQLKPLHTIFAAQASGIDLTQPLSDNDVKAINAAMNEHAVLVFRGQPLTAQQQLNFSNAFGPLDIGLKRVFKRPERLEDERLIDISNVDAQGQVADYQWVLDFMCQVAQAGATQLTIHARNAVLKGLSPKENREVPSLRYDIAKRLRQDVQRHFPHVRILLNGGLASNHDIVRYWHDFDGFMVGRAAYHTPAMLLDWDRLITSDATEMGHFFGAEDWLRITEALIAQAMDWREHCMKAGRPFHLAAITRHILGLAHGKGGSRYWRRQLSDYAQLAEVQSDEQIREFFVRANQQLRIVVEEEDADRV